MNQETIIQLLVGTGALIENDHFVYASGNHGEIYFNKEKLYMYTSKICILCKLIAENFTEDDIQVVTGPETGGIILSQWIVNHLNYSTGGEVLSIYAKKTGSRNFYYPEWIHEFVEGKRVLVVEDVLTTGGSAKKVVKATRAIGGNIIGLGALLNRGHVTSQDVDVPQLFTLVNMKINTWNQEECPLCKSGIPINVDIGKGKEYLAKKKSL